MPRVFKYISKRPTVGGGWSYDYYRQRGAGGPAPGSFLANSPYQMVSRNNLVRWRALSMYEGLPKRGRAAFFVSAERGREPRFYSRPTAASQQRFTRLARAVRAGG